jgi:hypothetical protein
MSTHGDTMNFMWHIIYLMQCLVITSKIDALPVFEPNDYFWNNHWDGVEEKWVAYARTIRKIIAEQGNFELWDNCMEDKLEYK